MFRGKAEGRRVSQTCRKRFPGNDLFAVAKRGQNEELRSVASDGRGRCCSSIGRKLSLVTVHVAAAGDGRCPVQGRNAPVGSGISLPNPSRARSSARRLKGLLQIADAAGHGQLFAVGEEDYVLAFAQGLEFFYSFQIHNGGAADALEGFWT